MEEQKVLVKKIDDKLYVEIPPIFKKPWWSDFYYRERYKEQEDGSIIFPCRDCNVTITKPILQKTSMGMVQTQQSYIEQWHYFDVPQLSALVNEGCNLLETWTLESLGLVLKEEITNETKEGEENAN